MFNFLFATAFTVASVLAPTTLLETSIPNDDKAYKIQIALLLDTSGSMDGLIEQAKSQLWKMVNDLATCKKNGKVPDIELALYEYGKSTLPEADGFMKQIVPLTTDLDLVSEKLFELRTNGGSEYCGWTIKDAVDKLKWSKSNDDLKIIFIAGNEEFTQGTVDYKQACKHAISHGIIVNTIFCGDCQEGIRINWKDGADRADGKYLCINQNDQVVHIESPYDAELSELSTKLNGTYIAYGNEREERMVRQEAQDKNAGSMGISNQATRALSKSSNAYRNSDWDLVDASKDKKAEEVLKEVKEEELPEEMRKMSEKERIAYIETKTKERADIQTRIQELGKLREQYVAEERKKQSEKNTLDDAMLHSIREQASKNAFKFE